MASRYRVVGPLAVAIVDGKRVRYDRDEILAEGADADRVEHLLSQGLIEVFEVGDPAEPVETTEPVDPAEPVEAVTPKRRRT